MAAAPTRERILDAAERTFAERGGADGASMRDLAAAAEVRLSQLSYYFGSKEALYRAVFARRADALALARGTALAEAMAAPAPDIRAVVEAFIGPSVRQRFAEGVQGAAFALMTAREAVDPRESARGVLTEHFDPTATEFLAAFAKLYPQASHAAMVDAYLFMVGALVMTMAAGDRAARLDEERRVLSAAGLAGLLLDRLTSFCAAGIDRLLVE
ncbi:TetR/AcrR family transcriptional regulator [uncultured Bosea sp.]|uniref:TetR/AcrR family transcriptional regulator n=1 Tax=uncultured Bosea sp. TaxID=211457 RepID=UPI0025FAEFB0|nr:TetR/AcrR family transcriptional regulator [uncultured Bosea sp.]